MSDSEAQSYNASFENYNSDLLKHPLDLFSFASPSDVLAPHPDQFELDLDSNLASFGDTLHILTVDSNDAYSFFRSEKPQWQGPLSTITVSSESHDSRSSHSGSFYNEPLHSAAPDADIFDFTDLDMNFQRVRVGSDYASIQPSILDDPTNTFGALPPTPPHSPPTNSKAAFVPRSSFSDYGPARRNSTATPSDYHPYLGYRPTVSPLHITTQLPPSPPQQPILEDKSDPRKKYRCSACPRAFARAYNLKTHMATHDPNRLKPYVCPQRSCGRSFSRKHDLGRHLISIHRDESPAMPMPKSIGVESGSRGWCDSCGKGFIGRNVECDCVDVK